MGAVKKFQEFTDLLVWQKAHELTLEIYRVTKKFPEEERFRLVNQICRSASSVPANIAEGFGRISRKEFVRFLSIAKGSVKESLCHLILARDLKYMSYEEFNDLKDKYNEISKMLSGLARSISKNLELSTQSSVLRTKT